MTARIAFTFLAAAFLALPAGATSLTKKDSERYDIAVSSGGGTMKTSISGGTTKSGVCPSSATRCTIEVDGVGEVEVSGSDDVVIRNGDLEVR